MRWRAVAHQREVQQVRSHERGELARELHDTVAHHVSAIAVQAQAGGVVAGTQPEKAAAVLAAIESEASRTLAEMRSMVRVLRDEESVAYAPHCFGVKWSGTASSGAGPTDAELATATNWTKDAKDPADVFKLLHTAPASEALLRSCAELGQKS